MAQLEREASLDSSEATSITASSTQEGELTIQSQTRKQDPHQQQDELDEDEEDRTLATTPEMEEVPSKQNDESHEDIIGVRRLARDPNKKVLTDFSSDDIMLLKKKLEEVKLIFFIT